MAVDEPKTTTSSMDSSKPGEALKTFLHLRQDELEARRAAERKQYQIPDYDLVEQLVFVRLLADLQCMREDYENGIRLLLADSADLSSTTRRRNGGLKQLAARSRREERPAALDHLWAGLRRHTLVQKLAYLAFGKSFRTATKYLKWLEQDGVTADDDAGVAAAVHRFDMICDPRSDSFWAELKVDGFNEAEFNEYKVYLLAGNQETKQEALLDELKNEIGPEADAGHELKEEIPFSCDELAAEPPFDDATEVAASENDDLTASVNMTAQADPMESVIDHEGGFPPPHLIVDLDEEAEPSVNGEENYLYIKSEETKTNLECEFCGKVHVSRWKLTQHLRTHTGERPFRCAVCSKVFTTKGGLTEHRDVHHVAGFPCPVCSEVFKTRQLMRKHVCIGHPDETAALKQEQELLSGGSTTEARRNKNDICKYCGQCFRSRTSLHNHMRTHTIEKAHKCDICGKSFMLLSFLHQHRRRHDYSDDNRQLTNYQCDQCEKSFPSKWKLTEHLRTHTGERPFKCDSCFKCFSSKGALKKHADSLHSDERFSCRHCGKFFKDEWKVNEHVRANHDETSPGAIEPDNHGAAKIRRQTEVAVDLPIAGCGETEHSLSGDAATLIAVKVESSGKSITQRKSYECSYCGKVFANKCKYNEHLRSHTGEKPFKCEICHKCYAKKGSLKEHYELHSDVNFPCTVCPKVLNTRPQLLKHMNRKHAALRRGGGTTTTAEQPRLKTKECTFCGKSFAAKNRLDDHLRTHTGEKPFTCELCGKSFHNNNSLHRHKKKRHGGAPPDNSAAAAAVPGRKEKPPPSQRTAMHMCTYCGKCFSHKTKLADHVNIHTGDKPYKCKVCAKSFASSINLLMHNDIHTDETFACTDCPRIFNTKALMYKHRQKIHRRSK